MPRPNIEAIRRSAEYGGNGCWVSGPEVIALLDYVGGLEDEIARIAPFMALHGVGSFTARYTEGNNEPS